MAIPESWTPSAPTAIDRDSTSGHKEHGRTVCIHSFAVLPAFQRKGLGKLLLRSYIQRIEGSNLADRIALLSHDELVPYYEALGFVNKGPSKAQWGGGGWSDMIIELKNEDESSDDE